MRIHLGHHFYGAGNLGDDFMLAGFLSAMRELAPAARYTASVPFPLEPLRRRFPEIEWLPYEEGARARAIAACDVWLGLGGSPFQGVLSRWFIDHLLAELAQCTQHRKPMYFLGVGVQSQADLASPDVARVCAQAAGIWTRDPEAAAWLRALPGMPPVAAASDLAHVFFRAHRPPGAAPGRLTFVPNFDYGPWTAQRAFLDAFRAHPAGERIWLAQESRELPGAERALFAALADEERAAWRLVAPEREGAPLPEVLAGWPSGEWLVTCRYHAALAGAWAGSRVAIVATNQKLRSAAHELGTPLLPAEAGAGEVGRTLAAAPACRAPEAAAERAFAACAQFVRSAVAHRC